MIQWHGDSEPVFFGKSNPVGDKAGVVDDIEMRQCCALGVSRGSGRELDVDRIVGVQIFINLLQLLPQRRIAKFPDIFETHDSRSRIVVRRDDKPQMRQLLGIEAAGFGAFQFRCEFPYHSEIVGTLEGP